MTFLRDLQTCLGHDADLRTSIKQVNQDNPLFVYVKMPGDLDPMDRHELFADPLQKALDEDCLGKVTGGGSMFVPDGDGDDEVEFCGIDVCLYNAAKGLALLCRELVRLHAPPGTTLLYELDDREWEEPVYRMKS